MQRESREEENLAIKDVQRETSCSGPLGLRELRMTTETQIQHERETLVLLNKSNQGNPFLGKFRWHVYH